MLDWSFLGISLDKIFMALLGISAFVFLCINLNEIFKSKEIKYYIQLKRIKKTFCNLMSTYKIEPIKSKEFLKYADKSEGANNSLIAEIVIEDDYLCNRSPYMKR